MFKKDIIKSVKLLKYYEFINYNLIYNNSAINRYKKDNFELSANKINRINFCSVNFKCMPLT